LKPNPSRKAAQVLLVEDNWGDVLLMREALRQLSPSLNLNIVTDGENALAYLNGEGKYSDSPRPDFILLDLNLPRMDGRAFLRRLRGRLGFQELPVVVLTSSRLDSDVREAEGLGISGYLAKPGDLAGFLEVARRLREFWLRLAALLPPEL